MQGNLPDPHSFPDSQPHSQEFWKQMVRLGGTAEQIAPNMPYLTSREIAEKLSEAHSRIVREESFAFPPAAAQAKTLSLLIRPNCRALESNWNKCRKP